MADSHTAAAPAATSAPSFLERHHFLFRRLHSLSGIIPVGFFVIFHLFTNFQILVGDFQHEVEFIHGLPALLFMEITIWLGIGFHAGLGLVYTFTGKSNVRSYPWQDNWRYTLQRVTGIIALLFIFFHVATLRWRWDIFGFFTPFFVAAPDGHPLVAQTTAYAIQSSVIVMLFYVIGVLSVVFHWVNGLWTAAISWGLTISVAAQKRWGYLCAVLGVALTIFGMGAVLRSYTYELTPRDMAAIEAAKASYQAGEPMMHKATPHGPVLVPAPAEAPATETPGPAQH